MNGWSTRFGWVAGILSAVIMIPAYAVGTPDMVRAAERAPGYFAGTANFLVANGMVPLVHVLFFLIFLGALTGWLRQAGAGAETWAAFAGGMVFITLSSIGFTAEILAPAVIERFPLVEFDPQLALASLTMATWLYHYCQVGAAVMVAATSLIIWRTGALPRWFAGIGALVVVLTLLHTWLPLLAALASLLWIAVISVALLLSPAPAREPAPA